MGEYLCGAIKTHKFLGKKWSLCLMYIISPYGTSFNEIYHATGRKINQTLLSKRLKEMNELKIIFSKTKNYKKQYFLTNEGKEFLKIIKLIKLWSLRSGHQIPFECRHKNNKCTCEILK